MKRINIIIALILLGAAAAFAQNTAGGSGLIRELTGTVELKPAGASDFIAAKAGDQVTQDTVVSTGFKSTAIVAVGSSVITVRPLTRLTLREISASSGTETINLSLQTGRVRVDLNPPAGSRASMTVQSPMATASVRGTSFEFDTQSLRVLEGTVSFQGSSGREKMVGAGTTSEILGNGIAAGLVETNTAELQHPSLAGIESGFRNSKMQSKGERIFTFVMAD